MAIRERGRCRLVLKDIPGNMVYSCGGDMKGNMVDSQEKTITEHGRLTLTERTENLIFSIQLHLGSEEYKTKSTLKAVVLAM